MRQALRRSRCGGETEAAELLGETLQEEKDTDEKLTELARGINVEAEEAA